MPAPQSLRVVFSKGGQAGGGEAACPSINQGRLFKGGPCRKRGSCLPLNQSGSSFQRGARQEEGKMPAPQSLRVVFSKWSPAGGGEDACPSIGQGRLFKRGPGRRRGSCMHAPQSVRVVFSKGGPGRKRASCLPLNQSGSFFKGGPGPSVA
jgi:hypothetical protein